jgi:hypothetical protein
MNFDTDIKEKLKVTSFLKKIEKFNENNLIITPHAMFRLNEKQRKIYQDTILKKILFTEKPLEVGVQFNGCLALIYNYGLSILKMVVDLKIDKLYIVTFYILNKEQRGEILR